MIKIFLSVRNRLAITKKCIHSLKANSTIPHQIYIYDNSTNYLLQEHFIYFMRLYEKGYISQVTFTSNDSTFNAFSKATTCNLFGSQHLMDPKKDSYDFLVILDNDIILTPEWDKKLLHSWRYVSRNNMDNIKIIGQYPGGIKLTSKTTTIKITDEIEGRCGFLGGSGLWSVRPNFFDDVGFLDLKKLVNHNKKHDQFYWRILDTKTKSNPYIMGINQKLGIHCGSLAGSVCNTLTRDPKEKALDKIAFKDAEEKIDNMDFDSFYKTIENNVRLIGDW